MSPRLRRVVSGLLSLLSRCYPATFRDRYGDDLRLTYLDRLNAEHASGGTAGVLRYSLRMAGRVIWDGLSERVEDRRRRPRPSGRWRSDLLSIRRAIARRPGFYGAAVVTFGLGVGATASVFSVVDAVLLRPLPYPSPRELVVAGMAIPEFEGWGGLAWRLADAVRRDGAWEAATVRGHQADLAPDAQNPAAVRIPAAGVSGNFFTIMGTRPALGRTFTFAEDATPTSRVAVLSDALWHRRWGGDSTILGRSIRINGEPTEVIGILPPGFHPPEALSMGRVDLYVPATVPVEGRDWDNYQRGYFRLVGRLAPGVTVAGLQNRDAPHPRRDP